MDKERILHLADVIEKGSDQLGFNMAFYEYLTSNPDLDMSGHKCGTVACIAGWAVHTFPPDDRYATAWTAARDQLGLTTFQADQLFEPSVDAAYEKATPEIAAKVLRHLAETGEVEWERFVAEPSDE